MFKLTADINVSQDEQGRIRHVEHIQNPYLSPSLGEPTPEQLADQYLVEIASTYKIDTGFLSDLSAPIQDIPTNAETKLHRYKVKEIDGSYVVKYIQSHNGIRLWRANISVHIAMNPPRVTASSSTLHESIRLGNDLEKVAADYKNKLTPEAVTKLLEQKKGKGVSKINDIRLVIYQYDPKERIEIESPAGEKIESFEQIAPTLQLPAVPDTIIPDTHYAAAEIFFDLDLPNWKGLHWLALIEPTTGAILYLRALVSAVSGSIFRMDPISLTGNNALIPSSGDVLLNSQRTTVILDNLISANPQDLHGTQVDLQEIEPPVVAEPTTTSPFNFSYNVSTTNFSAVNAYYHVNWFFNLISGMGFNLNTYFDGTTFPVPVDHWGLGGSSSVNAHCPGNTLSNGIGHFCFASAQAGQNVGIADDIRVVIHEFGHALLWDHVHSPNFGFAHSAGDALAAILMDPDSIAPDRFLTFPWPQTGSGPLDRRHDRLVTGGWGWFGSHYNTQYGGEQVLSTTLFRIYRSIGGDSPYPADRSWAARYLSYLIVKAIGTLTSTTNDPTIFATALMNADLTTVNFEGHPGGAVHKVIRWGFEKQGLYQPNAVPGTTTPVTNEGNPPNVDVYIDDGRHGEYPYLFAFWENQNMWVRRNPDGGTVHQDPIVGVPNYMYVRVKNRGIQTANNVIVKAYHCHPGTGLAWPDHWGPMDIPQLSASGPIPSGGETVVGPFKWVPEIVGHECLLAISSATGDSGNDTTVFSPIAHSRFVPFDNNIGQRNVHPVILGNWRNILEYVKKLTFQVVNPFKKSVKVELVAILPKELTQEKYWILFGNQGGNKFELGPRETRKVSLSMVSEPKISSRRPWETLPVIPKPGILKPEEIFEKTEPKSGQEPLSSKSQIKFRVITLIDGQNMGGMTYVLQLKPMAVPTGEIPTRAVGATVSSKDESNISSIFETLKQLQGIKDVKLKKLNLDIEFEE
jgi:zinc metalloprotease ZmpB